MRTLVFLISMPTDLFFHKTNSNQQAFFHLIKFEIFPSIFHQIFHLMKLRLKKTIAQFYIQLVFKAPLCITLTISDQKTVSGSLFLTQKKNSQILYFFIFFIKQRFIAETTMLKKKLKIQFLTIKT